MISVKEGRQGGQERGREGGRLIERIIALGKLCDMI